MNLPDYNFLPAPLWLITILHVVTLTLHLTAMNFLFGGLLVILLGRMKDKWANPAVTKYVKLLPAAVAATVTLGVAPLLFLQVVYYEQAYSAAIVSAWWWIGIIDAVIIGYYFLYGAAFSADRAARRLPVFLTIAVILLAYVSFVYSTVFSLAEHPDLYRTLYADTQSGVVVNTYVGSWALRWPHMILGAVTLGGFFVGIIGRNDESVFKLGKSFFLMGMIGAMLVGLGYLLTIDTTYLSQLMRSPAIWLLFASILLTLGSVHFFFKRKFFLAGVMLFVSMLGMVSIRHALRLIVLEEEFRPETIPVNPQWSVFLVFLVCFLLAIGLVWYMLKLFFAGRRQAA
jgi:hypothetical protein